MELIVIGIWTAVIWFVQICLCFRAKKLWVKWLPVAIQLILTAVCVAGYALSNWENWAYLILSVLLLIPLAGAFIGWLICGMIRLVQRVKK